MNLDAMQNLVAGLRESERIPADGEAVVQICLSLAAAVDADPENASLWREYRAAEADLRELTKDGGDGLDDWLRTLVLHEADVEPADQGSPSGGDS